MKMKTKTIRRRRLTRPKPCSSVVALVAEFKRKLIEHTENCKKCHSEALQIGVEQAVDRAIYSRCC